jgi:hypothetical protein
VAYSLGVKVTAQKVAERYWKCESCGSRGEVTFQAVGQAYAEAKTSAWQSPHLAAGAAAEAALAKDEERVLAMVVCPTCGKRAPGAIAGIAIRIGLLVALGAALAFLFGDSGWLLLGGCALAAVASGWRDYRRIGRAAAIRIIKLKPGPSATPGSRGRAR